MLHDAIIICGPTASGKTAFALDLIDLIRDELKYDAEIINADGMQLYSDLKILTAHPNDDEIKRAPHNLFGILPPTGTASIAMWKHYAEIEITRIKAQNKIPILCGGTGFYINSMINGISNIPEIASNQHLEVQDLFNNIGRVEFFKQLEILDPVSAKRLNIGDTQRILRAFEVVKFTGKPLDFWWAQKSIAPILKKPLIFSILPNKIDLHAKCQTRIVKMLHLGVIDEVKNFDTKYRNYDGALVNAIGFMQIRDFLHQKITKDDALENMYLRTKQYAKRQYTWFANKLSDAHIIDNNVNINTEQMLNLVSSIDVS